MSNKPDYTPFMLIILLAIVFYFIGKALGIW